MKQKLVKTVPVSIMIVDAYIMSFNVHLFSTQAGFTG